MISSFDQEKMKKSIKTDYMSESFRDISMLEILALPKYHSDYQPPTKTVTMILFQLLNFL